MKNLNPIASERGFILILVYIILIFLSVFSFALFARHTGAIQATERYQNKILAFNAAEAGIDFALRELATDAIRRTDTASTAYHSPGMPLDQATLSYTISPVTDHPNMRRIDATGCAPTCAADVRGRQTSDITVYSSITQPAPPGSLFEYGILTMQTMNLSGMTFDNYNSNQGAYGGSNISDDGAVAADSTAIGAIALAGTTVKGDAEVSEHGNPNTGITVTNSTLTGSKGNLPAGWSLGAPIPMGSLPTPPIELGSVTDGITLAAGTYHATEIKIAGKKSLVATGAVKIYVDGAVDITGQGTTVAANKPGNLHIYVTGNAACKIRGNGSFFGGLYAPNSDVTFQTSNSGKGGTWFGAVVAKTFSTFGGGAPAFHFDLAMKEAQAVDPNQVNIVRVTAWQEMNSLAWDTGVAVP